VPEDSDEDDDDDNEFSEAEDIGGSAPSKNYLKIN